MVKKRHICRLACSDPPSACWTLRLLAEKMVELKHFSSISHECIRQVLKKTNCPLARAALVYSRSCLALTNMEDVLDLYARPEDPRRPVVCVDETSKQHLQEMRPPLPVMPKPYRYDPEYKRNGVSNLFMIFAPLFGFRHVEVTDQRRSIDFAHICRDIVDVHFPDAKRFCWFAITPIHTSRVRQTRL